MCTQRVKHLGRHGLSAITILVMLLSILPMASLPAAMAAPTADQTLTGSEVEGNLKIMVKDTGSMGVWRYVDSAWQRQIFAEYSKGSRLYYDGSAYTLSKEGPGDNWFNTWEMNGTDPTLVSNTLNGNTITTVWNAGSDFVITQKTTYNDGNSYYRLEWDITNVSGAAISDLRFFHGEDTYLRGGDNGAGWWDATNTTIGAQKDDGGTLQRMYLQGISTPYAYDSLRYTIAANNANAGALSNTVDDNVDTDNGYALEWRQASLAAGATWNIIAFERFTSGASGSVYVIAPISTNCDAGTTCDVTYQVSNPSGSDVEVDFSVSGDQPTWNPTITSHTNPVNVPANSSINVVVQISVPAGTADETTGNFTLTATPTGGGDAASDTAAIQVVGASDTTVQLDFSDAFNADVVENTGDPEEDEFDPTGARMVTQAVAEANVPGDDDKGMPNDGVYPANDEHPVVTLIATDDNDGYNAWKASGTVTQTLAVSPTGQYNEVHIFASAGGAGPTTPAMFKVTLNYADASSTTGPEFTVPDWFGDVSAPGYYLIDGMDRFQNPGYQDADTAAIFGFPLLTNPNKTLESIEIEVTDNSAGSFVFFGGVATTASTIDTDGDGTPDGDDIDDDNDGIPDSVEMSNAPADGDTDGDGIPDHRDLDSDNDGINDVVEADGTDANGDGMHDGTQGELTTPPDTDSDGQPDYVDLDSDNDTLSDLVEGGSGATDDDNDGVADGPDADGDGIVDDADDNDGQFGEDGDGGPQDTDGDNTPDYIDTDSDDDGTDDIDDAGNGDLDGDDDGQVDDATDADGDGIPDNVDEDDNVFGGLGETDTTDTDNDGIPDDQDIDDDNDGIPDSVEMANAPANGDTDGDGILDHLDLDSDNDGINDVVEADGTDADGDGMHDGTQGELTTPPDTDGDGQPDYVDLDSDNDSISDLIEGGSGATDLDHDGVADGPDADGDGIVDDADDNDGQFGEDGDDGPQDTDGDDTPDYIDTDSDDDGTDDIDDAGNGDLDGDDDGQIDDDTDNDSDGIPDNIDSDDDNFGGLGDTDGDGIPDGLDIDDDNDGIPDTVEMANAPANGDSDGDGIPDHRDLDSDNDGINDVVEADGTDADGDGMHDGTQGELTTPPDTDGDGQPDYVDVDSDNDSISDLIEGGSGATDTDSDGVADGPDADGDGIVDDADDNDAQFGEDGDGGPQDTDGDNTPDYIDTDSDDDGTDDIDDAGNGDLDGDDDGQIDDDTDDDGDGIPDNVDDDDDNFGGLGDTDGDGIPDSLDIDDDNDGIPDSVEIANTPGGTVTLPGGDTDGDGIPDHRDLDSDNDGINDVYEAGGTDADGDGMHDGTQGELTNPPDTDGDGQPDYVDLDSDNDTVSDLVEGGSGATDADNDGVADGPDADGDGIVDDADDNDEQFGEDGDGGPQDTDGDNTPDYIDTDSDDDGTDDIDDAGNGSLDGDDDGKVDDDTDRDSDGIPDNIDAQDDAFGGLGGNRTPTVQDDDIAVPEGVASTLDVLANDSDPEGQDLTITQISVPGHGSATTDGATIVYTPTTGYLGSDSITYTASDGTLEATGQVSLTVSPVTDLEVSQQIETTLGGYDFVIVARNLGSRPAPGAVISDTFPAIVDQVRWTCVGAGGASCAASGTGRVLSETLTSFPAGGVVTYTVTSRSSSSEISYNTVTIAPPEGVFDLYMDNNSASRPTSYRLIFPIIFKYAYTGPTR